MSVPLRLDYRGGRSYLAIVPLVLLLFVAGVSCARGPEPVDCGPDDPSATERAVCEVLRAHGLPIGLLPRGAKEFQIDEAGRFEVRLERTCIARFEDDVQYDARVTGTLSFGQIGALSGVSAQELFLWFPVKGISVDVPSSGVIYFDVGVARKQFPLSLFETPPHCKGGEPPAADLREGREMALAIDKSKPKKLEHELDQEDAQRTAIL